MRRGPGRACGLLIIITMSLGLAISCRSVPKVDPVPQPLREPEPCLPAEVPPPPEPSEAERLVQQADRALTSDETLLAALRFEEALERSELEPPRRAEVRLRMAMLYADPGSSIHDRERAGTELGRVVEEDPGSLAARQAEAVRTLLEGLQSEEARLGQAEEQIQQLSRRIRDMERELGACRQDVERIKNILLPDGDKPGPDR